MSEKIDDVIVNFSDIQNKKQNGSENSDPMSKNKYKKKIVKSSGGWEPGKAGALAICRYQCEGHWQAAMLLFWIKWRWQKKNKPPKRNKEWIVASAQYWAKEAGLSYGEYKNKALPTLKRLGIIEVGTWKYSGKRQTWIHLKLDELKNEFNEEYEFYEMRRQSDFEQLSIGIKKNYVKKKPNFSKKKKKGKSS